MPSTAGVGYSEQPDSTGAGTEAARAALEQSGGETCDLAILFSTSKHDHQVLYDAVRATVGPRARIVGGGAIGVMTNNRLGYEGCQVGVAVLTSDSVQVDVLVEPGVADDGYAAGLALGKQVDGSHFLGEPSLVLMYDIVKRPASEGLALNPATPLLTGISEVLKAWPPIAGCGLVGDQHHTRTPQWVDDRLEPQLAIILALSGSVRMDTVTLHGLQPMSSYRTVTATEGHAVLELDGRPALAVIGEMLGADPAGPLDDFPQLIILGVNEGDKFGVYREEDYINQVCTSIDHDRQALVMSETYLGPGDEVQLMRRGTDFGYIQERVDGLFDRLGARQPVLALYIDCAGRTAVFLGTEGEEGAEIQRVIGNRVPLLGMYSGNEIARVADTVRVHNMTGVLCLFSE